MTGRDLRHPLDWPEEARSAYVACAIDTDGWVSLRVRARGDGAGRIIACVGVTNQSREFLERVAAACDVVARISSNGKPGRDSRGIITREPCWQVQWRSPLEVQKVLAVALPFLVAKYERAAWAMEFVESRITDNGFVHRSSRPYDEHDWELARLVTGANGRTQVREELVA